MRKTFRNLLILTLVAATLGFITRQTTDLFEITRNMELFGKAYKEVNTIYVDETNPTALMRTAIDAMLGSLDPYTNYYSESVIEESKIRQSGQLSGIGAEIDRRGERIVITSLEKDGPADRAGIEVGDELLQIDRERIAGVPRTLEAVFNLLNGERESQVDLQIKRSGLNDTLTFNLYRESSERADRNVPYYNLIGEGIGYVQLTGFDQNAGLEVADATKALKDSAGELKGLILDLRGNPGGRLDEAVNVCNVFIAQGQEIVEMRGRSEGTQRQYYTLMPPVDIELPVVVLVNHRSASASEIVSGALQDLDRGVVVGRRSFGKGLVQNFRPLSFNTQMKITVARYFTPSGRCIQAIDYSERDESGSPVTIPDSLRGSYQTTNGRPVAGGGGIDPDVRVDRPELKPVTRALLARGLIFDYVNLFQRRNEEIDPPREFRLSEATYQEFKDFVRERGFGYETQTDREIENLEKALERDKLNGSFKDLLEQLRQDLKSAKTQDLEEHQAEIKKVLTEEIIRRYYFQDGVIEAGFDADPDLIEAREILLDPERYRSILAGE